ncbi:uncharacterized protein LOC128331728 isoform X2 [Hemicordylus capensis]|uniref:uncharacterized protein LOC128331728 isoform X2 n=1 Tax=Hemicordylus capensis TaxID=884348 RepID=UPI002302698E|nr:uncharacterized protein LOC128331728 isoform X2 [Hemicordylus capensis]
MEEEEEEEEEEKQALRGHLEDILGNLRHDQLQAFYSELLWSPIKTGYRNIPGGELEEADGFFALSDRLINHFGEDYSVEVTLWVLNKINCEEEAKKLLALIGKGSSEPEEPVVSPGEGAWSRQREIVKMNFKRTLMVLGEWNLETFKDKLREISVKDGFENIPEEILQKAGWLELSDILLEYYREDYAVEVTAGVLRTINRKDKAQRLLSLSRKGQWDTQRDTLKIDLMGILLHLGEVGLKKFKEKLSEFSVKEGFEIIPKETLQKARWFELSDILLEYYRGDYAVEVTAGVLRAMNRKDKVQRLLSLSRKGQWDTPRNTFKIDLMGILLHLGEVGLEKFKEKLSEFSVKEGFENIPKETLQKARWFELGDILWKYYREDYAVEVTAAVLEAINHKVLSHRLIVFSMTGTWNRETVKMNLVYILWDLEGEDLKTFKDKLSEFLVEGFETIPKETLQEAHVFELSDILLKFYTEDRAVEVTAAVLEAINCKDQAQRLLTLSKALLYRSQEISSYYSPAKRRRKRVTVKINLMDTLIALGEEDLRRFKDKLSEFSVKEGFGSISKEILQKSRSFELSDILLKFYTEDYAAEVTFAILLAINQAAQTHRLLALTRTGTWSKKRETVKMNLVHMLMDLGEEDLKAFKDKLSEFSLKEGFENIPKEILQTAHSFELSDILLNYYREDYAVEVTAAVLEAISCKDQAHRLFAFCRTGPWNRQREIVKMNLMHILMNLDWEDLYMFKARLHGFSVKEGFKNIPKGILRKVHSFELSDILLNYYRVDHAVKLTVAVLESINHMLWEYGDLAFMIGTWIRERETVKTNLMHILMDLDWVDLKGFKDKLSEFPVKEGFKNIPKEMLQGEDWSELSDTLLTHYGNNYAVEVTATVLEAIDLKDQAHRLRTLSRMGTWIREREIVKMNLMDILMDLGEEDLKMFQDKLREFSVKERHTNIPKESLQETCSFDLSDILLKYYGPDDAVEVTAAVLEAINHKDQAHRLLTLSRTGTWSRERETIKINLMDTLIDLGEEDLKMFKDRLSEFSVKKGFENIPKEILQKSLSLELSDILLKYYRLDDAVAVTAAVLEAIKHKDQAHRLLILCRTEEEEIEKTEIPEEDPSDLGLCDWFPPEEEEGQDGNGLTA